MKNAPHKQTGRHLGIKQKQPSFSLACPCKPFNSLQQVNLFIRNMVCSKSINVELFFPLSSPPAVSITSSVLLQSQPLVVGSMGKGEKQEERGKEISIRHLIYIHCLISTSQQSYKEIWQLVFTVKIVRLREIKTHIQDHTDNVGELQQEPSSA